nr:MAG TPA: DNA-directed RNA polymerase subunit alpha [Caudoviricetes sp.]
MAQQVPWDQQILDEFIRRALLSEEDQWLLRSRIGGMSRSQQAEHLGLSERSVDRRISRLKSKYDHVQPRSSGLPPRRRRAADTWTMAQ